MATLLDRSARELLDSFAAGRNTPGAGSAAALMGALSGSLLQAVAKYTLNAATRRSDPLLRERSEAILEESRQRRERLLQAVDDDAAAFDLYWRQRTDENLKRATEIPIEIAEECLALAELGIELYGRGFRNARAEARAAALAAIAGGEAALHTARLNLKAADTAPWTEDGSRGVRRLRLRLREVWKQVEEERA